jgi:sortase A
MAKCRFLDFLHIYYLISLIILIWKLLIKFFLNSKFLERLLFSLGLGGLLLYGLFVGQSLYAETIARAQFDHSRSLVEVTLVDDLVADKKTADSNGPKMLLWSDNFINKYQQAITKGGDTAIAVLKIDSVDIEVAVFDGATNHNLDRGVARIDSTGITSSDKRIGIAGHRDGWFRPLKDIKIGAIISLETLHGVRNYRVYNTKIVDPSNVGVLKGDSNTLVLVTCYPFYFAGKAPKRFIVEATELESIG